MWDQTYDKEEWHYGHKPNDFLLQCENHLKDVKTSLCLGSGEGRNALYLLKLDKIVEAFDLSSVGLEKFTQKAQELGFDQFKAIQGRFGEYEFLENQYDLMTAIWFHGDANFRKSVYKQVKTSLKKGGLFLLEAYTPEQVKFKTGGPPVAEMMYSQQELEGAFSDFEILWSKTLERDVQEGQGHSGQSSVVQFLAKKI